MNKSKIVFLIPVLGLLISGVAAIMSITAGLGTRFEFWNFRTGLSLLSLSARIGVAGIVISIVGLILYPFFKHKLGLLLGTLGLVLGLVFVGGPWTMRQTARKVPPIHDITTDTTNPPQFVAALPLRVNALNSTVYEGEKTAELQKKAYPDIQPLILDQTPDQAFDKALATVAEMGWHLTEANRGENRIEAVDTTFWMGFKDDIVIRLTPTESGTRLDIRSESRVGKSDVGTNAKRIRKFLANIKEGNR